MGGGPGSSFWSYSRGIGWGSSSHTGYSYAGSSAGWGGNSFWGSGSSTGWGGSSWGSGWGSSSFRGSGWGGSGDMARPCGGGCTGGYYGIGFGSRGGDYGMRIGGYGNW